MLTVKTALWVSIHLASDFSFRQENGKVSFALRRKHLSQREWPFCIGNDQVDSAITYPRVIASRALQREQWFSSSYCK